MRGISCLVNFKSNLCKNVPYYDLLIRSINRASEKVPDISPCVCEQAVLFSGCTLSKICEGYQFTIAFSGCITNGDSIRNELSAFGYHFLTDKDAEIVLSSYIHWGEKCAEKLVGEFSFIIYDAMRRQVFVLTDSAGTMPVFYAKAGDEYILSTSFKGIFEHPNISKKISAENLCQLLSCQNRIPDCVLYDVYTLPSCSFLKISKDGVKKGSYTPTKIKAQNDFPHVKKAGLISSGTSLDFEILKTLEDFCKKYHTRTCVYAERFSDNSEQFSTKNQHLLIDDGTVLWALETVVLACGFPFMSGYDFLLPMALKRAKGNEDTLFFSFPDRYSQKKNYIRTLIKNGAFYSALEENMKTFAPKGDMFIPYPAMIADCFETSIRIPDIKEDVFKVENQAYAAGRIKTALRHILLDIISKEHSPIIAFFKRSALLRLCEGGFSFSENENESELIAYLIKLNIWFETNRPRIV